MSATFNKPPRKAQSCGNCNAFVPLPNQPPKGWCRARPPMPAQGIGQQNALSTQMVPIVQGIWPPTSKGEWCRSWEPMEDQDDGRQS